MASGFKASVIKAVASIFDRIMWGEMDIINRGAGNLPIKLYNSNILAFKNNFINI
jgi:hypothetical protein